MTTELDRAVKTVVRQCMGISPGEDVLVVSNPVTEEIGALMRNVYTRLRSEHWLGQGSRR